MRFHRCAGFVVTLGFAALLLTGSASAALTTSLINGDFSTNDGGGWDPGVNGWSEQSSPDGSGIMTGGVPISGSSGAACLLIGDVGATGRIFQSLGTIDSSDVGKVYELTGGAAAHDWLANRDYNGNVVASFRTGTTTTSYGTRLGKVSTVYGTVFSGSNGLQDGVGDQGNFLQPFSATFAPATGDIGTEVFAAFHLYGKRDVAGQCRYALDNLALNVTSGYSGVATSLVNPGFDSVEGGFYDPLADDWLEHELKAGPGPSGNGVGIFQATLPVSGTNGDALVFIGDNVGDNQSTAMQSLGFISAADVGKELAFSVDTVAWDWLADQTTSGEVSVSFRAGMSPDGEAVDFAYGDLLGIADSVVTGVTDSDGTQDGTGDDGDYLQTIAATYTVAAGDVGKELFAAINLDVLTSESYGENRYIVDNAVLTVIPEPTTFALAALGLFGLLASGRRRKR